MSSLVRLCKGSDRTLPAATAGPSAGGLASDNVEFVTFVPSEVGTATGARLFGHKKYLAVTSRRSFSIYDVRTPEAPVLLSTTPFGFAFENEDVATALVRQPPEVAQRRPHRGRLLQPRDALSEDQQEGQDRGGRLVPGARGGTSAAYWITNEIVYAIDYQRGFDVLRYTGFATSPTTSIAPSRAERPRPACR